MSFKMSQFDKLIELIKQNIDKIELKKVAELFEIKRGNSKYTKEYILENPGDYPVYSGATKNDGEMGRVNTYDYDGEFLILTACGEHAGTFFHRNGKFSLSQNCWLLKAKTNNNIEYIKYVLEAITKKYVNSSSAVPNLGRNVISNITLPIPPIHIQNQIVDFLSSFSENKNSLIQSITKEIELRKQQYNYYHNLLFKENSNKQNSSLIEYKFLSDLFEIKRGNSKYTKEYILENSGDYPVYSAATKNDGELGKINTYDYDGEFLTATLNGDAGHVFYRNGKFSINSDSCVLQAKSNQINIKYFYFLLSHIAIQYRNENGGRPKLPLTNLKEISLPIPPIHIQNQIVEILDEFEQTSTKLNGSLNENVVLTDKQFSTYQKGIINILLDKRERERERRININC
ncbi:restriction endonuclease subunit S [Mesomycoplasma bovoculi]|nr:restriction endonuclease subunit S [Mesomycoplasma bovoculi]